MKVHLIPSKELAPDVFTRVIDLLQTVTGVNTFHAGAHGPINLSELELEENEMRDRDQFDQKMNMHFCPDIPPSSASRRSYQFPFRRKSVRWTDLFREVEEYRQRFAIPPGEFVILLTPVANRKNWFALLDQHKPYNGFIHTDDWEFFIPCDPAFPIAFEVMALILQKHIFRDYSEIERLSHERAIGCISDLCMKKSDIILKMRTADICPDCMQRIEDKLSMPEIHHALSIMESLRVKMLFAQNFKQNSPPSRLEIRPNGKIVLIDYGQIEIKMPTLEKAVYLLFLKHPEGLYITELSEHRAELKSFYAHLSMRGGMREIQDRIDNITKQIREVEDATNILRDKLSVIISRIKKSFNDAIGQSLAAHYIIQGEQTERRNIRLDRSLVDWKFQTSSH